MFLKNLRKFSYFLKETFITSEIMLTPPKILEHFRGYQKEEKNIKT